MNAATVVVAGVGLVIWLAGGFAIIKARRSYSSFRHAGPPVEPEALPTWQRLLLGKNAEALPSYYRRLALRAFILITIGTGWFVIAMVIARATDT